MRRYKLYILPKVKYMTEILAVFRSRSQAVDCAGVLKNTGMAASLINTPKEANVGCGLSVKVPRAEFARVKQVIARSKYSAFYGYLGIDNRYGRIFIVPIR